MLKTLSASVDSLKRVFGALRELKRPAGVARSSDGSGSSQLVGVREMRSFTVSGDSGSPISTGDGQNLKFTGSGATVAVDPATRAVTLSVSASGMSSFYLDNGSSSPQTVTDGETVVIAGGAGIGSAISATNTITISLYGTVMAIAVYNSSQTLTGADYAAVYTGSGGEAFTLPAANAAAGRTFMIKNFGGGDLDITAAGSDNVDGHPYLTLAAGQAITVISDGAADWYAFV